MVDRDAPLILTMFECYDALRRNGWHDAQYAPYNIDIELIEIGSTGIHRGYRLPSERGDGFWIVDEVDVWPSNPILFRLIPN